MESPIQDILDSQISQASSRIPFAELCGFYAALMEGVKPPIVARASGLDLSTVYHLNGAGTRRGGQIRYPKIRAEFLRMGGEDPPEGASDTKSASRAAFVHRYLTTEIAERLRVAHHAARQDKLAPRAGYNPRAGKYRGFHTIKDRFTNGETRIQIDLFHTPPKPGWKWKNLEPSEHDLFRSIWRGDSRREECGFATSGEAYAFCELCFSPTEEQMNDGSWDAAFNDDWLYEQRKKNP